MYSQTHQSFELVHAAGKAFREDVLPDAPLLCESEFPLAYVAKDGCGLLYDGALCPQFGDFTAQPLVVVLLALFPADITIPEAQWG